MMLYKQLNLHDPKNGIHGDCDRTTVACFLNKQPHEVPNWYEHEDWSKRKKDWLKENGLELITTCYDASMDIDDILKTVAVLNTGKYYLLIGESKTGCGHVVICYNDAIIWDPSLTDSGIIGPHPNTDMYHVEFLVRSL